MQIRTSGDKLIGRSKRQRLKNRTNQPLGYDVLEPRQLLATNLVANGGFEQGSDFAGVQVSSQVNGWTAYADSTNQELLDVVPTQQVGNILKVDVQAGRFDRVFQDIATEQGQTYLLTFDVYGPGDGTDRSDEVRVLWNNEQVGGFRGVGAWQSVGIELTGANDGLTRLEFRESFSETGGDGRGPYIDNVAVQAVTKNEFANGGFEETQHSTANAITDIEDVPNWFTDGPVANRTATIRQYGNFAPAKNGNLYWKLDNANRYDRIFHSIETEADKSYVLTYDMRSPVSSIGEDNQVRVRWNGKWAATHIPTTDWQTFSVEFNGEKDGTSWLDIREPFIGENGHGDGSGPWIDNFAIYEMDSSSEFSLTSIASQTAIVGSQLVANVEAVNAQGTVEFEAVTENGQSPEGVIVQSTSSTSATIRWTPDIGYAATDVPFRIRATDESAAATETSFSVSVLPKDGTVLLSENDSFSQSASQSVELGQAEGTRTIAFDLFATFDVQDSVPINEDIFQVFLADENDRTQTLLDNGKPGTAVFSLSGDKAEYQPGLVRFDGSRVEIDVTSLGTLASASLYFQLINSDADNGTKVGIGPVTSVVDSESSPAPLLSKTSSHVEPANSVDIGTFNSIENIELQIHNVRYVEATGSYSAEIVARNNGPAIGRQLAVVFADLPAGVNFTNATGETADGNPYFNLASGIGSGGLATGEFTHPVLIEVNNPTGMRFKLIPTVLSGGTNAGPVLGKIAPIIAVPGDVIQLQLNGQDADGDTLTYSLGSTSPLPNGMLTQDGRLLFKPAPGQHGTYEFTVTVSDGVESASQSSTISIQNDLLATTRFSGTIQDINEVAIPNLPIEIRDLSGNILLNTTTDSEGHFSFESATEIAADTVVVRGDLAPQNDLDDPVYPFIAEKLPLVLGHDVYTNAKNIIYRPIYLPALDVEGGTVIDPASDITVEQEIAAGEMASVFVEAGTLKMDDGSGAMVDFDGTLSITEVPASLTPASLPVNLIADTVVTIQPGEMLFTSPAELSLPNRGNHAPGTTMDLWSINPATGDFDIVGVGQVSEDGETIQTISGGINNSSWHIFIPPPDVLRNPDTNTNNEKPECNACKATGAGTSEVELHSGALRETHNLVTYQSLGQDRGLQFYYNSLHADPQQILSFEYVNVEAGNRWIVAELEVRSGEFVYQVPGFEGGYGLDGGEHFWSLPEEGGNFEVALQADLSDFPTGTYEYTLRSGLFSRTDDGDFSGASTDRVGTFTTTNLIDSPFGAGWSLAGQQAIIENADGSVFIVDGSGTRLQFYPVNAGQTEFRSALDDFSLVEKLGDGTFQRTTTDETVYQFDLNNRLETTTDRNGRTTTWQYSTSGRLEKLIDPVGLETSFEYTGEKVTSVVDPAGRTTQLQYDSFGNLEKITDPDGSERQFGYDVRHRMTSEINQRGILEEATYNFAGRVERASLKDGSERFYSAAQMQFLLPQIETTRPNNSPTAKTQSGASAIYSDSNGNTKEVLLDQLGQAFRERDGRGDVGATVRNGRNQVVQSSDPRGFNTRYSYDAFGNLNSVSDEIIQNDGRIEPAFPEYRYSIGQSPVAIASGDFNDDGIIDFVTSNLDSESLSFRYGKSLGGFELPIEAPLEDITGELQVVDVNRDGLDDLIVMTTRRNVLRENSVSKAVVFMGDGDGVVQSPQQFTVGLSSWNLVVADFDDDGLHDIAALNGNDATFSILTGDGDGSFSDPSDFTFDFGATHMALADFDNDGIMDVALSSNFEKSVAIVYGTTQGFEQPETIENGLTPSSITTSDFNGDGKIDLAIVYSSEDSISVLLASEDRNFTSNSYPVSNLLESVYAQDLDGDSDVDLILAGKFSDQIGVLEGNGDGIFSPEATYLLGVGVTDVVFEDFNRDGSLDLMGTSRSTDSTIVLHGTGQAGFEVRVEFIFPGIGGQNEILTGDFNGDGIQDLATYRRELFEAEFQNVSLLVGNGDGTFTESGEIYGDSLTSLKLHDFNNDGLSDILVSRGFEEFDSDFPEVSGAVEVFLSNPDGSLTLSRDFFVDGYVNDVNFADFNNDGLSDIVALYADSALVALATNDGGFFEFEPVADVFAFDAVRVTAADFDNDGNDDIGLHSYSTTRFRYGNGDGTFNSPVSDRGISLGDGIEDVLVADLNGDGFLDVIATSPQEDFVSYLVNAGDRIFNRENSIFVGGTPESVAAGDYNRDGVTDLAIALSQSSAISIGFGVLDSSTGFDFYSAQIGDSIANVKSAAGIVSADFNGDGRLDLATIGEEFGKISISLNASTQSGPQRVASDRTFTYDTTFNQLTSSTDEYGRETLYTLDPNNGNRVSVRQVVGDVDTDVNGETDDIVSLFTYTANGLVDTSTDPLGRRTVYEYDEFGQLISITHAADTGDEATQIFEYDSAGNQTAIVDENGSRTEFEYDLLNRLIKISEPDPDGMGPLTSPVTEFSLDSRGNVLSTIDSRGNVTSSSFDSMDRLSSNEDALLQKTTFSYDLAGNLASVSDPLGFTTTNIYDPRNRLVATVDPEGGTTRFKYDAVDNLTSLTDPVGNRTFFEYDARSRLVRETDPLGEDTFYRYDAADNLIQKADRNGRVTEFEYDELDRLVAEMWIGDDGESAENTIEYFYDKAGNLLQVDDAFSGLGFNYDNRDRVQTVDNAGTPNAPNVVLTYTYDGVGNVLSVSDVIDGDAGATTSYEYDGLDRTISIQQSGPSVSDKLVDFAYNELGQFDEIARYSDLTRTNLVAATEYEYDELNRLIDLDHTNTADEVLAFYDFEYDPSSRITKLTDIDGVTDYSYDDRSQLTGADRNAGDSRGDESYAYDENGNRTDSHLHGEEYETSDGNRLRSDGTYQYEYDAEGNTIKRIEISTGDSREFQWDHRNRLVRVTDALTSGIITQEVGFSYDSLDRRVAKTVDSDGAGSVVDVSTFFVYDREDVLLDFVDSNTNEESILDRRYVHGPLIDQVISQEGSETHWLLADHLGTNRDVIDQNEVVNHLQFDSFGVLLSQSNEATRSRFLYTGREFDKEIGLFYYRARYLNPKIGVFINEDPSKFYGNDQNLYRYVSNNVPQLIDSNGLEASPPPTINIRTSSSGLSIKDIVTAPAPWQAGVISAGIDAGLEVYISYRQLENQRARDRFLRAESAEVAQERGVSFIPEINTRGSCQHPVQGPPRPVDYSAIRAFGRGRP